MTKFHKIDQKYPFLELDPNSKISLKELLGFWEGEVEGLVPETNPKISASGLFTNIGTNLSYNYNIMGYRTIAEKELTKIQRIANAYLQRRNNDKTIRWTRFKYKLPKDLNERIRDT